MKRRKPKNLSKYSVQEIGEVLLQHNGYHAPAAAALGVGRSAITRYIAKHPELKEVVYDCTETRLDTAESMLDRSVKNGEAWAVCFLLKCKGQGRGYIEKQQIDFGGEINHVHSVDLDNRMKMVHEILESRKIATTDDGGIDCLAVGNEQGGQVAIPAKIQVS